MRLVSRVCLALLSVYLCLGLYGALTCERPVLENQEVLVVTAHPDDETMFFGPTLAYLVGEGRRNNVNFLVLSNGNAENLGNVRTGEMETAAQILGVPKTQVTVVDDPRLQDGMDANWDPHVVAQYVSNMIRDTNAGTVLTFDSYGISNHPNHRAVYAGCVEASMHFAAHQKQFQLLSLHSVPIYAKYLFFLDFSRYKHAEYTIVSNWRAYKLVKEALNSGHISQMTWYRKIWTHTSRYMLINELVKVDLESEASKRSSHELASQISAINAETGFENRKTRAEKPPRTKAQEPVTYDIITTYEQNGETKPQTSETETWITRHISRHINPMAHREL